jgi:hypothetical protein
LAHQAPAFFSRKPISFNFRGERSRVSAASFPTEVDRGPDLNRTVAFGGARFVRSDHSGIPQKGEPALICPVSPVSNAEQVHRE